MHNKKRIQFSYFIVFVVSHLIGKKSKKKIKCVFDLYLAFIVSITTRKRDLLPKKMAIKIDISGSTKWGNFTTTNNIYEHKTHKIIWKIDSFCFVLFLFVDGFCRRKWLAKVVTFYPLWFAAFSIFDKNSPLKSVLYCIQ